MGAMLSASLSADRKASRPWGAPTGGPQKAPPQMIRSVMAFSTARVRSRVPSLSRMVDT